MTNPEDRVPNENVQEWVRKAEEDFEAAQQLSTTGRLWNFGFSKKAEFS